MKGITISGKVLQSKLHTFPLSYQCLTVLGLCTGMRISELLQLECGNIFVRGSGEDQVIICRHIVLKKRRKNKPNSAVVFKEKDIPTEYYKLFILPYLLELKRKGKGTIHDKLFRKNRKAVFNFFRKYIGPGYGTHFMRRTYGRELYQDCLASGLSSMEALEIVRSELGHRFIETTMRYIGVFEQDISQRKHRFITKLLGEIK